MSERNKGNLYILMTVLLWSTGGVLLKYVPGNPIMINGMRNVIAFLFFCVYRKDRKVKINKTILMAAICITFTNLLFVVANKLTTAANAIVLQYTAPIFVLLWDSIYQKKVPSKKKCAVVLLAFSGMILFFFDRLDGGQLLGNLVAIGAGVCFSGVFFVNTLPDASSEDSSMIAFLLSFLISIPFLKDAGSLDMPAVVALLALGIFQVGLAYVIYAKGVKLTSPVSASLIGLLEIVLNPIWVFLVYGETIGKFALLGSVVILGAICINILNERK